MKWLVFILHVVLHYVSGGDLVYVIIEVFIAHLSVFRQDIMSCSCPQPTPFVTLHLAIIAYCISICTLFCSYFRDVPTAECCLSLCLIFDVLWLLYGNAEFCNVNWTANDHSLKLKYIIWQDLRSLSFYSFVCPCGVCLCVCPRSVSHSFDHTNLSIHI